MRQFFKAPVKVVCSQIPLSWHGELQAASPPLAWYPVSWEKCNFGIAILCTSSFALLKREETLPLLAGQL